MQECVAGFEVAYLRRFFVPTPTVYVSLQIICDCINRSTLRRVVTTGKISLTINYNLNKKQTSKQLSSLAIFLSFSKTKYLQHVCYVQTSSCCTTFFQNFKDKYTGFLDETILRYFRIVRVGYMNKNDVNIICIFLIKDIQSLCHCELYIVN